MLSLIVAFLCLIVIIANRAEKEPRLRPIVYGLLLLLNVGLIILLGLTPILRASDPHSGITMPNAVIGLLVVSLFALVATLFLLEPVRRLVGRCFPKLTSSGGFDPKSIAQMTGLIFCVYLLAETIIEVVVAGGLNGLADQVKAANANGTDLLTTGSVIEQLLIWLVVAAFGTGLFSRRSWPEVLRRLGLRWPTVGELWTGAIVAAGLIGFAVVVGVIWERLVPPSTFNQQTQLSQLISGGVTTLSFAFLVALGAALGEEVAFRGALQPVFGLWPTAIFFALTHVQYTLTPATLLIIGVALGFGWLRRRYNTTTAIIAHFLYDFTLLALPLYLHYLQTLVTK